MLKLGITVSKGSVQQYRRPGPARPPSQAWRTFLANHRPDLWAADLFTVQTLAFQTLYVLVFIAHGRRELVHVNVIARTTAWIWRQLLVATPWGRQPRYLLRDRDAVYGGEFRERAGRLGIETLLSPVRAPRANAVAERVIGMLRRECLDRLIVVNERHLQTILAEFVRFYNVQRPHRTLRLETLIPAARPSAGPIRSRAVLGGCTIPANAPRDCDRAFPPPQPCFVNSLRRLHPAPKWRKSSLGGGDTLRGFFGIVRATVPRKEVRGSSGCVWPSRMTGRTRFRG